jgi:hypothetical protein
MILHQPRGSASNALENPHADMARDKSFVDDLGEALERVQLAMNVLLVFLNVRFSRQHIFGRCVVGSNVNQGERTARMKQSPDFLEDALPSNVRRLMEGIPEAHEEKRQGKCEEGLLGQFILCDVIITYMMVTKSNDRDGNGVCSALVF